MENRTKRAFTFRGSTLTQLPCRAASVPTKTSVSTQNALQDKRKTHPNIRLYLGDRYCYCLRTKTTALPNPRAQDTALERSAKTFCERGIGPNSHALERLLCRCYKHCVRRKYFGGVSPCPRNVRNETRVRGRFRVAQVSRAT